ncbi:MAG: hypothetical protein J3K34DRAFT_398967 [Monoraphidium minutum]|nr:MAG: hypothetical protein J3K34DRAFT_398967 [Monoraphidium minutum]
MPLLSAAAAAVCALALAVLCRGLALRLEPRGRQLALPGAQRRLRPMHARRAHAAPAPPAPAAHQTGPLGRGDPVMLRYCEQRPLSHRLGG